MQEWQVMKEGGSESPQGNRMGGRQHEPSGWVCTVAHWTDGMGSQTGEIKCAGLLQGLTTKIGDGKGVLATKRVRKVPPMHLLVPLVCSAGCMESRLMQSVWHFSRKWLRVLKHMWLRMGWGEVDGVAGLTGLTRISTQNDAGIIWTQDMRWHTTVRCDVAWQGVALAGTSGHAGCEGWWF